MFEHGERIERVENVKDLKNYVERIDEMIERKVLFKTLSQNLKGQCEIFQAENGREALEIYEKEKIQIAILDIEMPGINGIQAAERRPGT